MMIPRSKIKWNKSLVDLLPILQTNPWILVWELISGRDKHLQSWMATPHSCDRLSNNRTESLGWCVIAHMTEKSHAYFEEAVTAISGIYCFVLFFSQLASFLVSDMFSSLFISFIEVQLTNKIVRYLRCRTWIVWYIYTLWKDSLHWVSNTSITSGIYFDMEIERQQGMKWIKFCQLEPHVSLRILCRSF